MKHLFTTFFLLLALLLPATAAAYDFEVDGIYYDINGNEAIVTNGDNQYTGDVTIPETVSYNGITYTVTAVGYCCDWEEVKGVPFHNSTELTNVTLPKTITIIGNGVFSGCVSLTNIVIPDSVIAIGEDAFSFCTGLTSINLPNSVTSIYDYAFYKCTGLTSVTIGNSVSLIGYNAFEECINLEIVNITDLEAWCKINSDGEDLYHPYLFYSSSHHIYLNGEEIKDLVIPNTVTNIGPFAFAGCCYLTSVTIPKSVTKINESAFLRCFGLTRLIINDLYSWCNILFSPTPPSNENPTFSNPLVYAQHLFLNDQEVKDLIIPNSVISINEGAFDRFSAMTSLTIPSTVRSIDNYAFRWCFGLTDVYCYVNDMSSISMGDEVFHITYPGDYSNRTLYVPAGSLASYQAGNTWSQYFGNIVEMDAIASSIELDKTGAVIINGETLQLSATVMPKNTENKTVAWASSNPAVATVDENGLVTALSVGTATITAMTTDGSNLSASCQVTVVSMSADNCFLMPNLEVLNGDTITIPVRLENSETIVAFQTDIYLPEGFSIVADEDDEYIVMPAERLTSDHILMSNDYADGAVRVICYTPNSRPISGNEGDLFYITVAVPDDAAGDYAINLRNSLLTTDNYDEICIPDAGAVLTVNTYIPGDANDSHSVTVTDIVVTAQYVLGMNPEPFVFDAADMNGDGKVTVTDIMLIAYLISHPTMNAPRRAPVMMDCNDCMSGEGISLMAGETRTVSIMLDNEMLYSAFQLDMTLPEGLTASNFALTDRASSHALDVNTLSDGKLRALCYSPAIEVFDGQSGALLTFDVTATDRVNSNIAVDGIELVTADCQTVRPNAFTIGINNVTSVNEVNGAKAVACVDYYNVAGQRLDRPASGVTLIVTTYTDGTRTTAKLLR